MKKKVVKKKKSKGISHTIRTDYLGKVYSGQFLKLVPEAVKKVRQLRREFKFSRLNYGAPLISLVVVLRVTIGAVNIKRLFKADNSTNGRR